MRPPVLPAAPKNVNTGPGARPGPVVVSRDGSGRVAENAGQVEQPPPLRLGNRVIRPNHSSSASLSVRTSPWASPVSGAWPSSPSKKNDTGTCSAAAISHMRLALMRFAPVSYFWIC